MPPSAAPAVGAFLFYPVFEHWFAGKILKVLNKSGKVHAILSDGSKLILEPESYELVPPGKSLPAKSLSDADYKAWKAGKLKGQKPTPAPAPKPVPTPTPTPVHPPSNDEPPMAPKGLTSEEEDDLAGKGRLPRIILPGNIRSAYKTLHDAAHHSDRVNKVAVGMFLKQFWKWANEEKFEGRLPKPAEFKILREISGRQFRSRGLWYSRRRILAISPRLFYAPIELAAETIIHEMCHQAVTDLDKVHSMVEQGHGIEWKTWMVRVGLNPKRYDVNENQVYMSKHERDEDPIIQLRREGWYPLEGIVSGPGDEVRILLKRRGGGVKAEPAVFVNVTNKGADANNWIYNFKTATGWNLSVPGRNLRHWVYMKHKPGDYTPLHNV